VFLKIIRNILISSKNSLWADELKKKLIISKKIDCDICTERPEFVKQISNKDYSIVIFENSYEVKNIDLALRALSSPGQFKPEHIILCINDFSEIQQIDIPKDLVAITSCYTMPLPSHILSEVITNMALPISAINSGIDSLDKEFARILIQSTKEVLEELNAEKLTVQKPCLLSSFDEYPNVSIRGKIIIKSEFFTGSLFISFSKECFLKIYELVVGEKVSEISKDEEDFASSIANMIYGRVKKVLADQGVELNMAIPAVDRSDKLNSKKGPIFVIPFSNDNGIIYIKIAKDLI